MARPRGIACDKNTRDKIQASLLINRLMDCAEGKVDLNAQQVNSAKTLLNKVLPDLKAIEVTGAEGESLLKGITLERVAAKNTDS